MFHTGCFIQDFGNWVMIKGEGGGAFLLIVVGSGWYSVAFMNFMIYVKPVF